MTDKLEQLKEKNKQLEVNLQNLTVLNSQLSANSLNSDDEVDLVELWNAIWDRKWIIIVITSFFAVSSVLYALSVPDEYKATALLAPASSSSSSSLSKIASQFGGLASLAGINLGASGSDDKTVVAMEIMKTWGFLESFVYNNKLEVEVFAVKGWNPLTNDLLIDEDIYNLNDKQWAREVDFSKGKTSKPTSWELFESIKDRISINQDKETGLMSISVEHYSAVIAKEWVELLVRDINKHIQDQDKTEAQKSIEYLNNKIKKITNTNMQAIFYQLIEEQTKSLMLAEVSDEYVFKTVSAAKVPEEKNKPMRALIVVLGTLLGGMFSVIVAFILHFSRKT